MTAYKKTPKPLRVGIKRDRIHPVDFLKFTHPTACEDCTHFAPKARWCTLGYQSKWHLRDFQNQEYERTGKMALCRFLEID